MQKLLHPLSIVYFCVSALVFFTESTIAQTIGHTKIIEIPELSRPGYLEPYLDPVFGSKVTRITGDPGTPILNTEGTWYEVARHSYSKESAWNCDQTLLLLAKHHGFPSKMFLDGSTFKPLFGRNSIPGTDMRWHPVIASVMVYVMDNVIGFWDVRRESTKIIMEFEGYSKFSIGPWEGNLSLDGRYIAIEGWKDQDHVAFVYDIKNRKKYPDLILNNVTVDWVSVSASGRFLVLNGKIEGEGGDQTQVYDLEGKKVGGLWAEYGRPSHYDLTADLNGDDVAVGVSKSKPDDGRVIKRRLSDGKVTVLTSGGYASHTSTRSVKRPGWAYVTYQYRGDAWPPYRDEVVAVKLDGSMTVERIAHMHTKSVDYMTEAHAVPSPDGKMVLWAGAWDSENGRPLGAYVAEYKVTN
ncbi:MAG: hypothetical protein PHO37_00315 [Kiritimatiellae bacterium]|nr:hypothetical protein [Kiritimatiellia bacterium]